MRFTVLFLSGVKQALIHAGIVQNEKQTQLHPLSADQVHRAWVACGKVLVTLKEQSDGRMARSSFERQWMLRDFKKYAVMTIEQALDRLQTLGTALQGNNMIPENTQETLANLERYDVHLQELARGYERDPQKLAENQAIIESWRADITTVINTIGYAV